MSDEDEVVFDEISPILTPSNTFPLVDTPCSIYQPSELDFSTSADNSEAPVQPRQLLNKYLASRDISLVRSALLMPWDEHDHGNKYLVMLINERIAVSIRAPFPMITFSKIWENDGLFCANSASRLFLSAQS